MGLTVLMSLVSHTHAEVSSTKETSINGIGTIIASAEVLSAEAAPDALASVPDTVKLSILKR